MKKNSLYLVIALLLAACGNKSQKNAFIEGTISGAPGQTVFLEKLTPQKVEIIDSAVTDKDGKFRIMKKAGERSFYRLRVGVAVQQATGVAPANIMVIITDSTETIRLRATSPNMSGSYEVEGSGETTLLKEISMITLKTQVRVDSINQLYQANPAGFDQLQGTRAFNTIIAEQDSVLIRFIRKHTGKFVSLQAISLVNPDRNYALLKTSADALAASHGNNPYVKNFLVTVQGMSNLAIGTAAPDFTVKTPDDKNIALSDFRGRYVLLDFWASWCRPCRLENPNLVKTYAAFKSKNFEIFGVSLDQNKDAWTAAIRDDNMSWKHGSDLGYWSSAPAKLYNISQVPYNILLDPQGNIIDKNLRGNALDTRLEEILNAKPNS